MTRRERDVRFDVAVAVSPDDDSVRTGATVALAPASLEAIFEGDSRSGSGDVTDTASR